MNENELGDCGDTGSLLENGSSRGFSVDWKLTT
jgi:hypothetical protein